MLGGGHAAKVQVSVSLSRQCQRNNSWRREAGLFRGMHANTSASQVRRSTSFSLAVTIGEHTAR